LVAAVALAGCGPPQTVRLTHAATILNRGNGAELFSLDPHYISANVNAYVVGDCLIGLTTEGPDGSAIPGAATDWQTSSDGKTWTFHLRNHVWSDGTPVTANDFVFAWRRLLDPKIAAPYAYYLYIVANAAAINAGKAPEQSLGMEALDDRTVVIRLTQPAPYLPEWLTHQTTWPVPRHVVLRFGNDWAKPEHFVCNGPYTFKEWIPNDHLTMVKNPSFYDAAHVRVETVNYFPTADAQQALKLMISGKLDTQESIPTTEIGWMRKNMASSLKLKPYLGNSYIIFNFLHHKFDDRRLREAMSLAYDRESATEKILRLGDPPAYAFVPPGTANYPVGASLRFKSMPFVERLARARALMAELGYGPTKHFHANYLTSTTDNARRLAAALQAMMRRIYIDIDIYNTDPAVYYRTLADHNFELAASAWIGDFNDAATFLDLFGTKSGNNYGGYSNPAFDRAYGRAQQQTDLKRRGELMREAEQIALDDDAVIPTRFLLTANLVQPYVKGWDSNRPNLKNFHRTRWLWIDPSAASQGGR
jgi:oligopeptide transport system substrate-binding protein